MTTVLCILDGFGLNPRSDGNAVALAKKINFDRIWNSCPKTTLTTFGERVGLPTNQMGNSEVGHLNIGAGRVVEQSLYRISKELQSGAAFRQSTWNNFKQNIRSKVHLIGLCSDGGVHSHIQHLMACIDELLKSSNAELLIHMITDGRDTAPSIAERFLQQLLDQYRADARVQIASMSGRYYAMDRDKRSQRTQAAYDAIISCTPSTTIGPSDYLAECRIKGLSDEFIPPTSFISQQFSRDDSLLFWNFRADRMRQIVRAMLPIDNIITFTQYDATFKIPYIFPETDIKNHLGEWIAKQGLSQLRVAETEKYAHVTYFLNGGDETPCTLEERIMLPSPRDVATYDLKPEMSANQVGAAVVNGINSRDYRLIVVNFANPDMVGHTGVLTAATKAIETVDLQLGLIIDALQTANHKNNMLVIADHGNAEQMLDYETGAPHTAHTTHPVPCIYVGADRPISLRSGGALCDVAPTILQMMNLAKPPEMTGTSLIVN